MTTAWAPTLTGAVVEFAAPRITRAMILTDVARGLATQVRFTGQTQLPISIAQHSVLVADAIMDETGDSELAAFGLLHDAHEFIFGDWTQPAVLAVIEAIDRRAAENGVGALARQAMARRVGDGIDAVKRTLDQAILPAAGLSFARFDAASETIRRFDLRALRSERDDLMGRQTRPWALVENLPRLKTRGMIRAWTWEKAEDRFRTAFENLCPDRLSAPATPRTAPAAA